MALPPVGASAYWFRGVSRHLPSDVELLAVHPPGRLTRVREESLSSVHEYAQKLAGVLDERDSVPTILIGHSYGGIVALETSRLVQNERRPNLIGLVLCATPLPADWLTKTQPRHREYQDEEISDIIRRHDPSSAASLEDSRFRELLVDSWRADLQALNDWQPEVEPKVTIPVTIIRPLKDPLATSLSDYVSWEALVSQPIQYEEVACGHNIPIDAPQELARLLNNQLLG